jgi:TrwC relaxase
MLSIAKLRVGQEAYQLSGVAQSLDDYYTGSGEAHGQWVGGSAARLGLTGQVDADDLRAVLAGLAPGNGGLTPNGDRLSAHPRRVRIRRSTRAGRRHRSWRDGDAVSDWLVGA